MDELMALGTLNCVYFSLLVVGVIYAGVILITGSLQEISLPDIDLDLGGVDIGGVELPEMPVHLDIQAAPSFDHGDVRVPSLSPVTIASFVASFGAIGLVATQLFRVSNQASLLWAAGGALVIATGMHFAFGYFLLRPQGSSEITMRDIIGALGEIITPIPADGVGEVAFVAQGARVTISAKSATGETIPRGTAVLIERLVGSTAIVRPQEPLQREESFHPA